VTKIKTELGYRDLVAITTAMEKTVKWLVENPPTVDWLSASYPEHDEAIRKALQIASS
jgi:dTDP-D-glucose 4,6-dehydratase